MALAYVVALYDPKCMDDIMAFPGKYFSHKFSVMIFKVQPLV